MRKMQKCFWLLSLAAFVTVSCGNKQNGGSTETTLSGSNDPAYMQVITIKPGEPVKLDNPETFIQIYILYHHNNKIWLDETVTNTNTQEVDNYLATKMAEFYSSFGLTEAEFVNYSQNNFEKINEFLEQNEVYKKAYEAVLF